MIFRPDDRQPAAWVERARAIYYTAFLIVALALVVALWPQT